MTRWSWIPAFTRRVGVTAIRVPSLTPWQLVRHSRCWEGVIPARIPLRPASTVLAGLIGSRRLGDAFPPAQMRLAAYVLAATVDRGFFVPIRRARGLADERQE